jgi:two-component system sensor histidine kinase BaeS
MASVTSLPETTMRSITWRIAALMFSSLLITVLLLVFLANRQMSLQFSEYLNVHQIETAHKLAGGSPEQVFLESIHRSLYWVGAAILLVGLFASYWLARGITVPLRELSAAADSVRAGKLGLKVAINSRDEVGKLASAFNEMSQSLENNVVLRRRFLADIAHELKTPLAVIQGNLEGMIEGVIDKSNEQLNSLYEETVHLNRLIKDLRDLTLAEVGALSLEREPVDINLLIGRAVNMLEPLAEEKQITIAKELEPAPPVSADSGRVNQILYNLLTNALRYSPVNGTIAVSSETVIRDGSPWLRIGVKDAGRGIAAEDLPFIFEHFYRADKSRGKKSGGSGIGLAIVKRLVEIHGGAIEVDSRPGQGACFFVYLPTEKNS